MSIESNFDVTLISSLALKEKQIQQNYRPIIAVHKWFARRPGTLFRGLILSEFGDRPLREAFFRPNDFANKTVADPFMGGGTPLIEANRVGCDVLGFDINPMAAWIVREELEHLDLPKYRDAAENLVTGLSKDIGRYYRTDCPLYGDKNVPAKYFLWVKIIDCEKCGKDIDLFPGYLVADDTRHPRNILVCAECGELNELTSIAKPGKCRTCRSALNVDGPARRSRCECRHCGHLNHYPRASAGPLRHRMFAIEYYNPQRRDVHKGRFFKKPDAKDLKNSESASKKSRALRTDFVPDDAIPAGDETDRLHRWGYQHYRQLFNERQILGLELSCQKIARIADTRVRHALATNLSDLLRYQNMLCRYDTMALKSLDVFSIHGFPVGLVQCESNLLGIVNGNGASVGSGGWTNIVEKYAKAKEYCDAPFEVRHAGKQKVFVPVPGEWIGEHRPNSRSRAISLHCTSATEITLPETSLDAVFTDPPYFGNVQYGELMDFCYVWLRKLVGSKAEGFANPSTRSPHELTGNATQARGLDHFTEGLSTVYRKMAKALKVGAPLAFTYHHNRIEAYYAIGVAILDTGFYCTASIPCPAEMGGSIHIHGTTSSIIDTVFVCRSTQTPGHRRVFPRTEHIVDAVCQDLAHLRAAGVTPTTGDMRCILLGHLTRLTIQHLRGGWQPALSTRERIVLFANAIAKFGGIDSLIEAVSATSAEEEAGPLFSRRRGNAVSV
jgi:putative DNA methylase